MPDSTVETTTHTHTLSARFVTWTCLLLLLLSSFAHQWSMIDCFHNDEIQIALFLPSLAWAWLSSVLWVNSLFFRLAHTKIHILYWPVVSNLT